MNVYYSPFSSTENKYLQHFIEILQKKYNVVKLAAIENTIALIISPEKKDVVVLNWYEDHASSTNIFKFTLYCCHLIILRIIFSKMIWVRHNFKPHRHTNIKRYKFMCFLLGLFCNSKVTHRPYKDYSYIPHPPYRHSEHLNKLDDRDIDNLVFGQIKKYKGIEELLKKWPKNEKLMIVGACNDETLDKNIKTIIQVRKLKVDYINEFISERKLNNLILRSKKVILPHLDETMIVSGAFYHAASFGANIASSPGGFYDYLSSFFNFIFLIDDHSNAYKSPAKVFDNFKQEVSDEIILQKFNDIVNLQ